MDNSDWEFMGRMLLTIIALAFLLFIVSTQYETAVNTQKILNILED